VELNTIDKVDFRRQKDDWQGDDVNRHGAE